jgi:hypothetical protein
MCAALFVVGIFFIPVTTAQQPTAANPPPATNPAPPKEETDIELNTVLMESTFMIQGQSAQGQLKGTVFIIGRPIPNSTPPRAYYVMVTAAHVLSEMAGDSATLYLRKKVDDKTNSWAAVPVPLQIRTNGQPLWKKHPVADVAVMYLNSIPTDTQITLLSTDVLADDKMLTE